MRLLCAGLFMFALFPRPFSMPATITLYDVQPTNLPHPIQETLLNSQTVTAIGVGSDGRTTYSHEAVISGAVLVESSSTTTLTDSRVATTATNEFVADASEYVGANTITNVFGQNETITLSFTCKFEGTTAGFCIDGVAEETGGGPIDIKTTTYSGPLIAYYTITENAAIPKQTQPSRGFGSPTWKTVNLISSLIGLVSLRSVIEFLTL